MMIWRTILLLYLIQLNHHNLTILNLINSQLKEIQKPLIDLGGDAADLGDDAADLGGDATIRWVNIVQTFTLQLSCFLSQEGTT